VIGETTLIRGVFGLLASERADACPTDTTRERTPASGRADGPKGESANYSTQCRSDAGAYRHSLHSLIDRLIDLGARSTISLGVSRRSCRWGNGSPWRLVERHAAAEHQQR
jgi:hypothetical protein